MSEHGLDVTFESASFIETGKWGLERGQTAILSTVKFKERLCPGYELAWI